MRLCTSFLLSQSAKSFHEVCVKYQNVQWEFSFSTNFALNNQHNLKVKVKIDIFVTSNKVRGGRPHSLHCHLHAKRLCPYVVLSSYDESTPSLHTCDN